MQIQFERWSKGHLFTFVSTCIKRVLMSLQVKDNIWDDSCQDKTREKNSNTNQNIEMDAHKTIDTRELFAI